MIYLTGFGPFGDCADNPTEHVARALDGQRVAGRRVAAEVLPVVFLDKPIFIAAAVDRYAPTAVLHLGVDVRADRLRLERLARNWRHDRFSGDTPRPIDAAGPPTLETTLDVDALVARLNDADLPAEAGTDAGRYVCNHTYYTTLRWLQAHAPDIPALFVHMPPWEVARLVEGARQIVAGL